MSEEKTVKTGPYVPALGFHWLTDLYDPLLRWTIPELRVKEALIAQAGLKPRQRVLDLGCGTATLSVMVQRACPDVELTGLDADPKVLEIARRKAGRAGVRILFTEGLATDLPYPEGTFDRILSSLLFHHLSREQKRRSLAEAFRVLKPGGELHIADWGQARSLLMRAAFFLVQLVDGRANTQDHIQGRLPGFIAEAGFARVQETAQYPTFLGPLSLYRAAKLL